MSTWRLGRATKECARFLRLNFRRTLLSGEGSDRKQRPLDQGGLVVTLSSIPSRISRIFPALNSLLDQTVPAEQIILALPEVSRREGVRYDVPAEILAHPRIRVLRTEHDWGPATKLIPTLRLFADAPETPILAVDDDNVYPDTFIETFQHYARAMPDAALSLRGCSVPPSRRWRDCKEFKGSAVVEPARTDVVQGCAGILVRPRFFGDAVFDYDSAPDEAFFVDDLWISGHLARRRVPAYVLPFMGAFVYMSAPVTFVTPRLDRSENLTGRNNDALLEHFAKDWGWS